MHIRERYADTNTFICSYIGTIGMAHGLDVVLRAARQVQRDVLFLIVGDGACRKTLEVEAVGLDNVRFTGLLPNHEIPSIIAASDASLVHLKKSKLFATVIPSKMFELMAMDVPVIMGVEGEARDIVMEARAGEIMEPENEQDLVRAIARIRQNGKAHYRGREYMTQHFNRDKLAQTMLDIIVSVTKKRDSPLHSLLL
jgi:glycosyltransferase involved in cell wall biosynthesis